MKYLILILLILTSLSCTSEIIDDDRNTQPEIIEDVENNDVNESVEQNDNDSSNEESLFSQINILTNQTFTENITNKSFSRFYQNGIDYLADNDLEKLDKYWLKWYDGESYFRSINNFFGDGYCYFPTNCVNYYLCPYNTETVENVDLIEFNEESDEYSYVIDIYLNESYFEGLLSSTESFPNLVYNNPSRLHVTWKVDKDTLILDEWSPNSNYPLPTALDEHLINKYVARNEEYLPSHEICDY